MAYSTSVNSVQSFNCVWLFVTPWTAAHQAFLSFTNSWSLLRLMSIESVMLSNHLILLSSPSPAFSLSQHKGLFQWVSSSHQVAEVLELQFQHQSFQWIFRTDFLYDRLVGSPCSPRDSPVFSSTTVQKHQMPYLALIFQDPANPFFGRGDFYLLWNPVLLSASCGAVLLWGSSFRTQWYFVEV